MSQNSNPAGRFGTFSGVFVPTVLTILGIILFLRTGWVVGNAGILGAFAIILLSNAISLFTALSLSSIATNMNVRIGGIYYMITRTLGLEIGGAIGIPLYLSQTISVSFYVIGFTEALVTVVPGLPPKLIAIGIVLLFGGLAYWGADFALKLQVIILGILAAAILSFFAGGWGSWSSPTLFSPETSQVPFWEVFAVFFPAVTGIAVGVSMSGDLKNPAVSIPQGTLWAVGITCLIYLATAFWLSLHAKPEALIADYLIMEKIALFPSLILAGVFVSTLSSALGSIVAGPRTLQALALDNVVPKIFREQLGSPTEPRMAIIVTTAAAVSVILIGDLNFVAELITMFFLNTYGMINLTAAVETLVQNPSFRPTFKTHWSLSLLGAVGCYGAMFLINPGATVIAVVVSYGIYLILKRRALKQDWDDVLIGLWYRIARFGLIRLESVPWRAKNWRPNVATFAGTAGTSKTREHLLELGAWLSSGLGFVSFFHLLVGPIESLAERGLRTTSCRQLRRYLDDRRILGFAECSIVEDFYQGIIQIMQTHGVAGIEPNTAILGWSRKPEIQQNHIRLMRNLVSLKKSILFLKYDEQRGFGRKKRIDIWWRGRDRNVELMLLMAHFIRKSDPWLGAEIRVLQVIESQKGVKNAAEVISAFLKGVRIEAEPVVMVRTDPEQSFGSIVLETGADTDLVFFGARLPQSEEIDDFIYKLNTLLAYSGTAIIVRSGEVEDILETD